MCWFMLDVLLVASAVLARTGRAPCSYGCQCSEALHQLLRLDCPCQDCCIPPVQNGAHKGTFMNACLIMEACALTACSACGGGTPWGGELCTPCAPPLLQARVQTIPRANEASQQSKRSPAMQKKPTSIVSGSSAYCVRQTCSISAACRHSSPCGPPMAPSLSRAGQPQKSRCAA